MNKTRPPLVSLAVLTTLVAAAIPQIAAAQPRTPAPAAAARLKWALKGHHRSIVEIVFSPDGETIATGSEDGTVRLWGARDGREHATLKLAKRLERLLLVWSPDSRRLATCWYRGFGLTREAQIWDGHTGELLATLRGHGSAVRHVEWSPDGRLVLTSSDDGTAKLWGAAGGAWALGRTIEYEHVDVSRETGSILAAVFTRKKIPDPRNVWARFAAGGRTIVISSYDRPPQLWSADGRLLAPLVTPSEQAARANSTYAHYSAPLLGRDGRLVATTERDAARLWDALTGELRHVFAGESAHQFSPDGRTLVTASWQTENLGFFELPDVILKLRDVETGEVRKVWRETESGVNEIYWSPEGKSLILNATGKTRARLLDADTGTLRAKLPYEGCSESLFSEDTGCEPFAFSADGRVASKLTGTLKLFDTATGRLLAALADTHRRAAFSPTNARLFAARGKDRKSLMLFEVSAR